MSVLNRGRLKAAFLYWGADEGPVRVNRDGLARLGQRPVYP